ncbi:metallophosphoesterase [Paenibacillus cremeus]|uniref:Calcineurin-like phosphoesterase domain-containing protein n=1 Tax=Paenibacillus cremeus TaxID=2163881 RepID=A0A559K4Q7_9BACL|nr:metallophosphoesterase [Paenibacillus cremeus]TVY07080.1 hypothetical protein FPZ49_25760 [Paenibacillus cremeus]
MLETAKPFSIILVPDTQIMTARHPELLHPMCKWIADQAEALNVRMVLHLGDVVNNGASQESQYQLVADALDVIHQAGLPMMLAMGNHDYDNEVKQDRSAVMFNRHFGRFYEQQTWLGGTYEAGAIENSYARMQLGGSPYVFLVMEFGPRDEVLAWADRILQEHADHKAIIVTHCFMYINGKRSQPGDAHNPKIYPGATGANDGEDVWHKLIKKHPRLIGVFSGHQVPVNVSHRTDLGEQGNVVLQAFQNWQSSERGGEGRLRILTIDPENSTMSLAVFNPSSGNYEHEAGYQVAHSFKEVTPPFESTVFPTL